MEQRKGNTAWIDWIGQLDFLIRNGGKSTARQELVAISLTKIPPPLRASVAQLFRRVNLPLYGVRLLSSVVRPGKKAPTEPTIVEKAEYAVCLIRIGAVNEGLALLAPLSSKNCAPVALYKAFGQISQWDYEAAIGDLTEYLALPQPSDYERLVAKTNLLAALISGEDEKNADALFEELVLATSAPSMKLLYGSVLEMGARQSLAYLRFDEMNRRLDKAEKLFLGSNDIHLFYARKLRVLALVTQEGATKPALRQIAELREASRQRHHWETLRECDRMEAKAKQDPKLFAMVYLGTPYPAYRRSLLKEFGREFSVPQSVDWSLAGASVKRGRCFDAANGSWVDEAALLKPGQLLHRFLLAMVSDFYKPQRLATLHSFLFPNEYYNPVTAPGRVHRALGRWRAFSRKARLGIKVGLIDGMYALVGEGSLRIRVKNLEFEMLSRQAIQGSRLKASFQDRPFSTIEAALRLGISRSSAQRVLADLCARGELRASGNSQWARYYFKIQ